MCQLSHFFTQYYNSGGFWVLNCFYIFHQLQLLKRRHIRIFDNCCVIRGNKKIQGFSEVCTLVFALMWFKTKRNTDWSQVGTRNKRVMLLAYQNTSTLVKLNGHLRNSEVIFFIASYNTSESGRRVGESFSAVICKGQSIKKKISVLVYFLVLLIIRNLQFCLWFKVVFYVLIYILIKPPGYGRDSGA